MTSIYSVAESDPNRVALIPDEGPSVTYAELLAAMNQVSSGLRAVGIGPGDVVAVLMKNRPEFLFVQLGGGQSGLTVSPINRHLTVPEVTYILADSGAAAIVTDAECGAAARLAAAEVGIPAERCFSVGDVEGFRPFAELCGASVAPEPTAYGPVLAYSSGTTGRPKGILRGVSGLPAREMQEVMAERIVASGGRAGGTYLSIGPLYHAAPNSHLLMELYLGKTVVLTSGFDPLRVLSLIEEHRVTNMFTVATMLHRLLSIPEEDRARFDVSSIESVYLAGSMCPVATKRAMIEWWGPCFDEYYGCTETGLVTKIDSTEWLAHVGSVGRVDEGCDIKVRDEAGTELPPGEIGLLHLRSSAAAFDYVGAASSIERDPEGYFVPGDMGYLDPDGYLYLVDRRTDMIISGGVNIYPAEIEAVLLDHPAVLDAVVIGPSHEEWGQSVVALVEPHQGVSIDGLDRALDEHCREQLAKFKVPQPITIVDQLPRNPAGKINRGRVRQAYESEHQKATTA